MKFIKLDVGEGEHFYSFEAVCKALVLDAKFGQMLEARDVVADEEPGDVSATLASNVLEVA